VRVSAEDRDEYKRMRDIDDREHAARKALIDGYLAIPAAGLARAVVESEGFAAIAALRRVNNVLRENGFQYPLGAQGVEDLISHMGKIQLHEDELQLTLEMAEAAVSLGGQFEAQEYQDVLARLQAAAAGE
jgi:hypothetical protein